MSCKDCIHEELCNIHGYINADECFCFKNKADFVEVVRCKDCNHGHWNQETCHGKPIYYCDRTDLQVSKYSFCSYGERVTDTNVGGK